MFRLDAAIHCCVGNCLQNKNSITSHGHLDTATNSGFSLERTLYTLSSHLHADRQRLVPHLQSRAVGSRIDGPLEPEGKALSRVARGVCESAQPAAEVALAHLWGAGDRREEGGLGFRSQADGRRGCTIQ